MDHLLIEHVNQMVYRRFPEMHGKKPKVLERRSSKNATGSDSHIYLFSYNTVANISPGKSLPRWVRVVVSDKGKIIKITTSH
jgi:hypothetical protein